jgi:hypothetical protein
VRKPPPAPKPLKREKKLELAEHATQDQLLAVSLEVGRGKQVDTLRAHFLLSTAPHYRRHVLEAASPNLEELVDSELAYANRVEEVRVAIERMTAEDKVQEADQEQHRRHDQPEGAARARRSERLQPPLTPADGLQSEQGQAIYAKILEEGYYVWSNAFQPSPELLAEANGAVNARKATNIFNSPSEGEHTRRSMLYVSDRLSSKRPYTTRFMEEWVVSFGNEFGYQANSWVWLYSETQCRTQSPHTDYTVDALWRHQDRAECMMPCAAVFSLQEGTALHVWPGSHKPALTERIHPKRVELPPGEGSAATTTVRLT